ncbi:hypothetical protein CXG81DRAFT_11779 [Caulochytrium protostelioides]|uniref:ABC transporter domain-containing protein n=1 Tax=Caulochytrium protostelioides TaxID=1555241 RepID=A0A4P9X8G9_9FUNG|nr:hypothetical protein CXG81DRAFT_11779 [Caulochytrium protostelioides]|eukprot:RKP01594.1 hypothetical protein CXG81DRAFT_11779 [Caulochytrium protostelioides]
MSQTLTSKTLELVLGKKIDIRHTNSTNGPKESTVNQAKLKAAEAKLAKKNATRELYEAGNEHIPVWNPDEKPALIVNQSKLRNATGKDVHIENFDVHYAGKPILVNADMDLAYGRHYGLVGQNGIGKTTLLRAIAEGELRLPRGLKILHVEQEARSDDTPALQSVLQADEEREAALTREAQIHAQMQKPGISADQLGLLSQELEQIGQRLQNMDADTAESRAATILSGLGFTTEQQHAATKTFSGGWRMRLALARALFCRPDLLLADEISNHLDIRSVAWLEKCFTEWPGTLLIVSHDRSFLDNVTTDILHLHDKKLNAYRGNFSQFLQTRIERRKNQLREYESQLQYRQHLQAFIDRWRYNANRAAQAQSKIKILEKLPPLVPPVDDDMDGGGLGEVDDNGKRIYFRFPDAEGLPPPIIQAQNVSFGYTPERTILENITFDVHLQSKAAVVGPNGAGKTTLIHLLIGRSEPTKGQVIRHGRLRIGLFSQHHVDQLDLSLSSVRWLSSQYPGHPEMHYRRILARFGLQGNSPLQPIGTLSGGQKSRVVFAQLAMQQPHLLVLDEPTNHLDHDSVGALADALRAFGGGVMIVSHDVKFLDAVCNEVWVCEDKSLTRFRGSPGCTDGIVQQYKASLDLEF